MSNISKSAHTHYSKKRWWDKNAEHISRGAGRRTAAQPKREAAAPDEKTNSTSWGEQTSNRLLNNFYNAIARQQTEGLGAKNRRKTNSVASTSMVQATAWEETKDKTDKHTRKPKIAGRRTAAQAEREEVVPSGNTNSSANKYMMQATPWAKYMSGKQTSLRPLR